MDRRSNHQSGWISKTEETLDDENTKARDERTSFEELRNPQEDAMRCTE